MKITKPDIYYDLPAADYHAQHDWLSNSGAKLLLKPSCPAKFKHQQSSGEEHKRHFDLGKVTHTLTLGDGDEFVVVQAAAVDKALYDAKDYVTKSAQAHRDAIYASGKVPILAAELTVAKAMAAKVRADENAGALLAEGKPEVSLFWVDEATGVKCRARLDWMPDVRENRRLIIGDLKTAVSSEPDEFGRAAARFGYVRQHDWYLDGIRALGIAVDPAFLFIVVEKDAPHVVTVGEFTDPVDLRLAAAMNDTARRVYRQCLTDDHWPGYVTGIAELSLPPWHRIQNEEYAA